MKLDREMIGLLAKLALTGGATASERIVEYIDSIPDEAIGRDVFPVWAAMREISGNGGRATLTMLQRSVPGMPPEYWMQFQPTHPDLSALRDEVLQDYQRGRYRAFSAELAKWVDDPTRDPEAIREALFREAETPIAGISRATDSADISFMDRLRLIRSGVLPKISTGWTWLDRVLGGGLFVGGDLAMTAIVAYTGVGKSRFASQIGVSALRQGHHVLYFAGESSQDRVMLSFGMIHNYIRKESLIRMNDGDMSLLDAAEAVMQSLPLAVYDGAFNSDVVRSLTAQYASRARQAGKLLLVIVDNIDHVIEGGQADEWKQLEQAAKGIYATSRRLDNVHSIILSQATAYQFERGNPPGLTDFARSKLIGSHCSNVIGLYRPLGSSPNDPKVLVSKCRSSGDTGEFTVAIDTEVGLWE